MLHHVGEADPPLAIQELIGAHCATVWVPGFIVMVRFPIHNALSDRCPFLGIPFASVRGGLKTFGICGICGGVECDRGC